tara:strand:- start:601 stop:858 length:258 start_codon:yes stop_codon:yes gene_type:complete
MDKTSLKIDVATSDLRNLTATLMGFILERFAGEYQEKLAEFNEKVASGQPSEILKTISQISDLMEDAATDISSVVPVVQKIDEDD